MLSLSLWWLYSLFLVGSGVLSSYCLQFTCLSVQGANLIGVDSLGMDVRAFSGVEAQTLRFSFNARVKSSFCLICSINLTISSI